MNILHKFFHYDWTSYVQNLKWKNKLLFLGKNTRIGKNLNIFGAKYVYIGNNVIIKENVSFHVTGGELKIEDGVSLGKGCDIGCDNKIIIKKNVLFGPYVHISDRDHGYQDINLPIISQGSYSKGPVIINEGCWFGFRSQVMSNVTIGRNCIIGAGCIVTKDIPDYSVVIGNPCRIVKQYNPVTQKWEKT